MFNRFSPGSSRTLNNFVSCARYSRKSDPKNNDNAFKVVKARVRLQDESGRLGAESSLNWELFSSKGNRFFLPRSLGPAWLSNSTTIYADLLLNDLVDFEGSAEDKLGLQSRECPQLLRENLHEIFPAPEVATKSSPLTLVELKYSKITKGPKCDEDTERGAKLFILAAREICSRLRLAGYWSDFMNPFSGKPFHSYAGKNLYKQDHRFRGLGMKLESFNHCLMIDSEQDLCFSGSIFTNAPSNIDLIRNLLKD